MTNFVLVRSPKNLLKGGFIGVGWSNVHLSDHKDIDELIKKGFNKLTFRRGHKKQLIRFFNLKEGDIAVVPMSKTFALCKVIGNKSFESITTERFSENRIDVEVLTDKEGNYCIPRSTLSTALQSRLKIRPTVINIDEFSDEFERHINSLKSGEIFSWYTEMEEAEAKAEKLFKEKMLNRITTGKGIGISSGGYGLEKLVRELFEIKGYKANITPKNASSGIDDIDVLATRLNEIKLEEEAIVIQVKHHKGLTGRKAVEQLKAYSSDKFKRLEKIIITSARMDKSIKDEAEAAEIYVMEGKALVDLIYDSLDDLSVATKQSLGIINVPSLI